MKRSIQIASISSVLAAAVVSTAAARPCPGQEPGAELPPETLRLAAALRQSGRLVSLRTFAGPARWRSVLADGLFGAALREVGLEVDQEVESFFVEGRSSEYAELQEAQAMYRGVQAFAVLDGRRLQVEENEVEEGEFAWRPPVLVTHMAPSEGTDLERIAELFEISDDVDNGFAGERFECEGRSHRISETKVPGLSVLGAFVQDDGSLVYAHALTPVAEEEFEELLRLLRRAQEDAGADVDESDAGAGPSGHGALLATFEQPLGARLDAELAMGAQMVAFLEEVEPEVAGEYVVRQGELLRLRTLDAFHASMRSRDGRLEFTAELSATGGEDALDLLSPRQPAGRNVLLAAAPRARGNWITGRLDLAAMARGSMRAWDEVFGGGGRDGGAGPGVESELLDEFVPALGADWLLALPEYGIDPERVRGNPAAALDGLLLGLSLRDAERLRALVDGRIADAGLEAARSRGDYRGFEVSTLALAFVPVHFAILDEALLVSFGRDGADAVRTALDGFADVREGVAAAEFAEPVTSRLERLPEDWQSVSWISLAPGALADWLDLVPEGMPLPVPLPLPREELTATLREIGPVLRRLELSDAVLATWRLPGRLRVVLTW